MTDSKRVIAGMPRQQAFAIRDDQYESDDLRHASTAPDWARTWRGPFRIEVEDSIRDFMTEEAS